MGREPQVSAKPNTNQPYIFQFSYPFGVQFFGLLKRLNI